jgi:Starch-binding associating with outer membrane
MKKIINYSKYAVLLAFALSLNACKDYFGDVNVDPNASTIPSPTTLLPTIEARITYTYWGDFSRYASLFTQHVKGADRQFAAYQDYNFVPDDFSTAWSNCYEGTLMDIQQLKIVADAEPAKFNAYSGIARALEAYTLMMVADYWGDAPYTDAFKGDKQLQPKYDTQDQLYSTINTLLNDARTKLKEKPGSKIPGGAIDIIYAGDTENWITFCNVLSARAYLHLGKKDAANYAKGLAELAKGGFSGTFDEAAFQFLSVGTGSAPWFQYNDQRGDITNGTGYTELAKTLADPRGNAKSYGAPIDADNPFLVSEQKAVILGYTEMKFIEAELLSKTNGDPAKTKAALVAGIKASMDEAQVTNDSTITAYLAKPEVNPAVPTLEAIMTQKYMALFLNPEVLNDIRRTGIPKLKPNQGTELPRRFLYPQTELDLNGNTPKGLKIYDKVGWDK